MGGEREKKRMNSPKKKKRGGPHSWWECHLNGGKRLSGGGIEKRRGLAFPWEKRKGRNFQRRGERSRRNKRVYPGKKKVSRP